MDVCFQEHHLQRALSAQQVYGTAEALVIPVPEISNIVKDRYQRLYCNKGEFKLPKQYVHVQGESMIYHGWRQIHGFMGWGLSKL